MTFATFDGAVTANIGNTRREIDEVDDPRFYAAKVTKACLEPAKRQ
jgi:hypothetical protein